MKEIIEGFLEFRRSAFPERSHLFQKLAESQSPEALFISCSDSRMVPELVTQQEPGSLFVVRNAGNIVPSYGPEPGGVSATIEYAVAVLAVKDVVICGHSNCGAMRAIVDDQNLDKLPAVRGWLRHADVAKAINADRVYPSHQHKVDALVRDNVVAQLANIKTHPAVAVALSRGALRLHGWVFQIETGEIEALDGVSETFVSLAENPIVCAFGRQA